VLSTEPLFAAPLGQILGKKFLVRRQLGSGGMGAVFEVEHVLTRRVGALKLLHARYAAMPQVVARFVMEASAAGRIDNPLIVQTFDAGELASGEPYMFMELLSGTSLGTLIQKRRRLPFEEARHVLVQAAAGLGAAHAAGIVHRDVKPENLFVCDGKPPFVKVLDFGISKFAHDGPAGMRLTSEGAPLGTPYYMSPEQVMGQRDLGPSTDIYSLGVVLYECLTGELPFQAETLAALGIRIAEGHYVRASERAPQAPPGLDDVIARAMCRAPAGRYPSIQDFAQALCALGPAPSPTLAPTLAFSSVAEGVHALAKPRRRRWLLPLVLASSGGALSLLWKLVLTRGGATISDAPRIELIGNHPLPSIAPIDIAPTSVAPSAPSERSTEVSVAAAAASGPGIGREAPRTRRARETEAAKPPTSRAAKDGLSEENPFP
jgi:serine/threonine-protein kinase